MEDSKSVKEKNNKIKLEDSKSEKGKNNEIKLEDSKSAKGKNNKVKVKESKSEKETENKIKLENPKSQKSHRCSGEIYLHSSLSSPFLPKQPVPLSSLLFQLFHTFGFSAAVLLFQVHRTHLLSRLCIHDFPSTNVY